MEFSVMVRVLFLGYLASSTTAEETRQCGIDYNAKLSVWVDNAPDCIANATYCPHFGLEYVCEGPLLPPPLPNATCQTGTRVRCSFPDQTVPLVATPVNALRVLAYNVFELRYLYTQSGQRERTCRVVPEVLEMHPDLDVIVFNEVFIGGCFAQNDLNQLTIRDILTEYGFPHYTVTVGSEELTTRQPENGGIFIASRWPILEEASHVYQAISIYGDSIMQKGVSYAKVMKTVDDQSKVYHVFGTHLQAYERTNTTEIRLLQSEEMYEFMLQQDIPESEPVIYAGDFNADSKNRPDHAADVADTLHATVPPIVGPLEFSYDRDHNDVFPANDTAPNKWLDYVLFSNDHQQPDSATLEAVRPKSEAPIDLCMGAVAVRPAYADSVTCFDPRPVIDLSDHYAVLGVLSYADELETSTAPIAKFTTEDSGGTGGKIVPTAATIIASIVTCVVLVQDESCM